MRRPAVSLRSIVAMTVAGLVVTVAVTTTVGAQAASDGASPYSASSYADRLLALVNDVRQLHGEEPLALVAGTTAVAADWTQHLASAHELSHNPRLAHQLALHGSRRWLVYGENVGVGSADDPDGLFAAYMNSPEHRANILGRDYRYVGVAVEITGSRAWNTFDFVDVYGTTPSPAQDTAARSIRPHLVASAPNPVAAVAATASTPLVRSTQRAARPTGPVVVHVMALHRPAQQRRITALAPTVMPVAWSSGPVANTGPTQPHRRSAPAVFALAVIALALAARRWLLVAG